MSNEAQAPSIPSVAPQSAPQAAPNTVPLAGIDKLAQALDQSKAPPAPDAPVAPVEAAKQEAKRLKSLKLKVYGEEVTEELPFEFDDNPEVVEYLTKQLQMSKAAQRAMQEKGSFEKQVQSFVENLKGNTAEVLQSMGLDPVEFAAKVLEQEIEKQKLSPEERRAQAAEAKVKALEDDNKAKEEERDRREFEAHRKAIGERVENQMIQALDKSDLPHTPYVADRIAKYMLLALNDPSGPMELSPEEVIPLVREDLHRDVQEMIRGMSEDKLENFIGKDVFSKVRKKNIEKLKQQTPATAKAAIKEVGSQPKTEAQASAKEEKKINARTFFGI